VKLFRVLHPPPEARLRKELDDYNPLLSEVSIH
jgi:hypothetical protein